MTTKYIEIDRAIETALLLLEEGEDEQTLAYNAALVAFIKNMENVPAADVQPVRRGRWVVLGDQIENQTFDECKCSECGCVEYFNKGWKHFDYCPNCGARMEATE